MLLNNKQRLTLWLELTDPFDYDTFTKKCDVASISTLPIAEFAQKVGMLILARRRYPDMELSLAYLKLLEESKPVGLGSGVIKINDPTVHNTVGCGGCGGGKVA